MRIRIKFETYQVEAKLADTPTAKALYDALPITGTVNTWGDEIYFGIPVDAELEPGARAEVEIGDLAYWPTMPAFCIFFGPTPASMGSKPTAASPANVFGKLDRTDIELLRSIPDGETVIVEKA